MFDYFKNNNQETVTITKDEYESLKKYRKMENILAYIRQYYYVEPDEDAMLEMAIRGFLAGLEEMRSFASAASMICISIARHLVI